MLSFKTRRQLLRFIAIVDVFLLFIGITTGEEYVEVVVFILAIGMLLLQIIQSTTYCPFCKGQLFGFFIATNTTGAELFKFLVGVRKIKCHKCKRIIDTKSIQ